MIAWQNYGPILSLGAVILGIVALIWLFILQRRLDRTLVDVRALLTGAQGADLEAILRDYVAQVQRTATRVDELSQQAQRLEETLRRSLQQVGVVRFNPFPDTGGDQSFAIALLDAQGDGVVLSGLYSRAGVRVYAKPVKGGTSTYHLSAEEEEAIARALGSSP
ncbi:MAG TPA: DUF4446 family protein [Anaerolineae bacterium]|nr:DUF4446 family protein [Anaerolineae bacterium]